MTPTTSPTLQRRRLGKELRRLRDQASKTAEEVAEYLECSTAKINRIENGRTPVLARDVRDMLELYQVPESECDLLLEMAKATRRQGWWQRYADAVPDHFPVFLELESDAKVSRTYHPLVVPGLLQTAAYARELMMASIELKPDQIERAIEARVARQYRLLDAENPLTLYAIIDESALDRQIGGARIMQEQLAHLVELGRQPNINIYVIGREAGPYPGIGVPFTLLEFPEDGDESIVCTEQPSSALYLEGPDDVERYKMIIDRMRAKAYGWRDSVDLIEAMMSLTR